jgi:hypothetical protein
MVWREPEVVARLSRQALAGGRRSGEILKKRTLTNLYNERPAWLARRAPRTRRGRTAANGGPPISPDEQCSWPVLFALTQSRA